MIIVDQSPNRENLTDFVKNCLLQRELEKTKGLNTVRICSHYFDDDGYLNPKGVEYTSNLIDSNQLIKQMFHNYLGIDGKSKIKA